MRWTGGGNYELAHKQTSERTIITISNVTPAPVSNANPILLSAITLLLCWPLRVVVIVVYVGSHLNDEKERAAYSY